MYEQRLGVWTAVVDLGYVDGRRRRKYAYGRTEAEAITKRDELRRQHQLGVDLTAVPGPWELGWLSG